MKIPAPVRVVLKVLVFASLYVIAARIGRRFDYVSENTRVLLPQAGVALAGLMIFGIRYWPVIPLASLFVTLSAVVQSPSGLAVALPYSTAIILAIGNTVTALFAAIWLRSFSSFSPRVSRVRDVQVFLLVAVVFAPLLGASLAVFGVQASSTATGAESFGLPLLIELWSRRWFGLAISNLLVAPVLLTWSVRYRVYPRSGAKWGEAVLLLVASIWICLLIFTSQSTMGFLNYPMGFVPFPFILWAALRFGTRGASTITLVVASIAIYGTSHGFGPFVGRAGPEALLLLQIFITVLAVSGLLLAAAVAQRIDGENELLESQQELRALTARLQEVREEERISLAREIHDELGQQLTGMKMGLFALRKKLDGAQPEVVKKCTDLIGLSEHAINTVREIATQMRPGILDDLGVIPAMQWLVEDFREKTGLIAQFEAVGSLPELRSDVNTALFRILQESLTNVARHANANRVDVTVQGNGADVVLQVVDDGIGISSEVRQERRSLGVAGMRERAQSLGGNLTIGSEGAGTTVRATIPIRERVL